MSVAELLIDLEAICANWRALNAQSGGRAGAVVKADAYGLGAARVALALAEAGARDFFVAAAEEGAMLRAALGPEPRIFVFSGHMAGDAPLLRDHNLVPLLNSAAQISRHFEALPGAAFGIQLDSGMNRLGLEPEDWASLRPRALAAGPVLVMSHLACADAPDHPMNGQQLAAFRAMTDGIQAPRSLAATGGTLLGPEYHFDMVRPGVGLYGGLPFAAARPVVTARLPVIQTRIVQPGESVGYSNTWIAARKSRIATLAAGYADGLHRALSGKLTLWHGETPCPAVGRISMDMIAADITDLSETPAALEVIGPHQGVDALAGQIGTIGYEILTSLGNRYRRTYIGT